MITSKRSAERQDFLRQDAAQCACPVVALTKTSRPCRSGCQNKLESLMIGIFPEGTQGEPSLRQVINTEAGCGASGESCGVGCCRNQMELDKSCVMLLLEYLLMESSFKTAKHWFKRHLKATNPQLESLLQASKLGLNDALVEASERKEAWRWKNHVDKIERIMVVMLLEVGAADSHGVTLITAATEGYTQVVARLLKDYNVGLDKALVSACQQSTNQLHSKTKERAQASVDLLLNAGGVDREGHALQAAVENEVDSKKRQTYFAQLQRGRIASVGSRRMPRVWVVQMPH